jgi:hypothetical protein
MESETWVPCSRGPCIVCKPWREAHEAFVARGQALATDPHMGPETKAAMRAYAEKRAEARRLCPGGPHPDALKRPTA